MSLFSLIQKAIEDGNIHARLRAEEPMKLHTTFKIGGPAAAMVLPESIEDLVKLMAFVRAHGIEYILLGNGSNMLVSDLGTRKLVIKTCGFLTEIRICDDQMISGMAGATLAKVSQTAMNHSLTGLEFAQGIPGSCGGAVYMNAGSYGSEMKNVVDRTEYMDENGKIQTLKAKNHAFSYRHSFFMDHPQSIILKTYFSLSKGDRQAISGRMDELAKARREKQPLEFPSAGSVFKRPEGCFAGKLIEDAGLRGFKIGGAMVSEKHCGFIVNAGGATCRDVLMLVEKIQNEVYKKFGVSLECEIRYIDS